MPPKGFPQVGSPFQDACEGSLRLEEAKKSASEHLEGRMTGLEPSPRIKKTQEPPETLRRAGRASEGEALGDGEQPFTP